jgi:hypothetical protein
MAKDEQPIPIEKRWKRDRYSPKITKPDGTVIHPDGTVEEPGDAPSPRPKT